MGKVYFYIFTQNKIHMIGRKAQDFVTVKDVPAEKWITAYAEYLKKTNKITPPEFTDYIKTGCLREVAPNNEDWFYVRCAAVLRKIYLRPQLGVGRMAQIYGGKQRYGSAKKHHRKAAQGCIRHALSCLEGAGIVMRYTDKRNRCFEDERPSGDAKLFGRVITQKDKREPITLLTMSTKKWSLKSEISHLKCQ